ncbi:MOSC domain-containing protein [Marinibactrum halimedae]|uniref:Molybdenum cofactor biosynthesis protein n=1 Tax=Marinibactrum halimedae TaxID=1444977 RepID=A0AA37WMU2_9GAMM|nr:MOSC domain-containing protein [Marinibactrum halimedae]MCD9460402.1 MOSC domain-containing protein [Marinibactrum halimedae]GLS27469.1 molybdenum cofactor biosynthesis protein [Marinibactrum halimedae]
MKIISINQSRVQSVEYNGEKIQTGIFKRPTNEDVFISVSGLSGDAQADLINHGGADKAVYGFSNSEYAYWREALNLPSLSSGAFGENLTIENLDEYATYIGERFQVGECILEVSQPRVPCFKLGIALENVQAPKRFTQRYRTGVYFRVVQEGAVTLGDRMEKLSSPEVLVSVGELFQAYFDKKYERSLYVLTSASHLRALSEEWRQKIELRLMSSIKEN